MKVLLISCIAPGSDGGGRLVLARHFKEIRNVDLLVVSDGPVPGYNHVILKHNLCSRISKRITKTKLSHWGYDWQELFLPCNPGEVSRLCREFKPDIIVTVAHGGLWRLALGEARHSGIPLVSIFHDWWPAMSGAHQTIWPLLDKKFRELHQNSTVSLCVCEGMLAGLGPGPAGEILYPMPSGSAPAAANSGNCVDQKRSLNVIYTGNLFDYGIMVQSALAVTKEHPRVRLEAIGVNPQWPDSFRKEMQERGLWHDFIPVDKLGYRLVSADAFLVTMRFDAHYRRYMETSFPSKIAYYAQFHKPIIVWGPDYCSAVRWARKKNSALCVTDPSPDALIRALETVSEFELKRLADAARQCAETEFNVDMIQRQFEDALKRASKSRPMSC